MELIVLHNTYSGNRCQRLIIVAVAVTGLNSFAALAQPTFGCPTDKHISSTTTDAIKGATDNASSQPGQSPLAKKVSDITDTPSISESRSGNRTFAVGKILVNARAEQIWRILTDYNNAPEIFSNLQKCEVLEDNGSNKLVRQCVHPKGTPLNLDYIVEIKETAPILMEWHRKSGALKEVAGSWKLEPTADGPTKVTYSIYLDGGMLLPAWILRGQSKNYLPELLTAIKQASEKSAKTTANKNSRFGVLL
jgi:uncharacterized membrane protein